MDLFSHVYFFCMGIIKIYISYYLSSYWLHLLLIVWADVESNLGPGSDKMVRSRIRELGRISHRAFGFCFVMTW